MTVTTENTKDVDLLDDILGPTDPVLDAKVRDRLISARVNLLLDKAFFGNLATRLTLVNADEWCSTAATDGRRFYYNSRFIDKLRQREVEFLFGHEVLHCVYDHFGRRGDRHAKLWNIADDYCVNSDLIKHRVGEKITTVPCLYDSKYDGMSAEQVYEILYDNAEKIDIQSLLDQMLDEHMDGNGEGKGPSISAEERQAIRDEIKEAMLAAAGAEIHAGNIPAGVKRIIQDITAPKMNWRDLLRMQLESTIKSDFTWMRASRRGWHMDAVMPGMKNDEMIDIAIALDASGSISADMLKDFLSEVGGIMEQFQSYKIHVVTFDTKVYNPEQFDSDNLDSISDYEISGGGGTDFNCVYDYLKDEQIEPKRLIMFTDGYPCGSWGDESYTDTVFIIHGSESIVPPWGTWAYYSQETA